jgi:hypothetical protein
MLARGPKRSVLRRHLPQRHPAGYVLSLRELIAAHGNTTYRQIPTMAAEHISQSEIKSPC